MCFLHSISKSPIKFIPAFGAVIFAFLLAIHFISGGMATISLDNDIGNYQTIARSLITGRGFVDPVQPEFTDREPVFPLFLAGVYLIFGQRPQMAIFAQSLFLAMVVAWFAWTLGTYMGTKYRGVAVAICIILAPGVVALAALTLLTEILAMIWLMSGSIMFLRLNRLTFWNYAMGGLFFGLAAMTRFNFLFFVPGLVIILFFVRKKFSIPLGGIGLLLCGFALPVLLWTYRNYAEYGIKNPMGTKGGLEFMVRVDKLRYQGWDYVANLVGNLFGDFVGRGLFSFYEENIEPHSEGALLLAEPIKGGRFGDGPLERNKRATAEALRLILQHPVLYIIDTIPEFFRLNSPLLWYNSADIRHLFAGTHSEIPNIIKLTVILAYRIVFLVVLGIVFTTLFAASRRSLGLFIVALLVLYTNAFFSLLNGFPRYIIPMMPFYSIYLVIGVEWLWQRAFTGPRRLP